MSSTRARFLAGAAAFTFATASLVALPISLPSAHAADECKPGNPQFTTEIPPALSVLQAERAWTRTDGSGILVAVVDSGIDASNPHLVGAVTGGINLVGDGANPHGLVDFSGHGTAIAGQIAARTIEGSGIVGLAPGANLLSVRVFRGTDDESVRNGFGPDPQRLASGIRYAVDSGAAIINVSLSDYTATASLEDAVNYAVSHGSLVVASAGNRATATVTSDSLRYPAAYPGALSVTATDATGVVTYDSIHGSHVEVAAPGSNVLTTATGAGDCMYAVDAPSTSYATAYVSAAAALVAAAHPDETPDQWAYRLKATAIRGNPDARSDSAGWGVIQPSDAIDLLAGSSVRGPVNPLTGSTGRIVLPDSVTVSPDYSGSPLLAGQELFILLGIAASALLGIFGTVSILRLRRRTAASTQSATSDTTTRPGLLDRDPPANRAAP